MTHFNELAQQLKDFLDLKLNMQAVKFITDPAELPADVFDAQKELGHLSLCQAFALAKRQGKTVYTTKFSEWCWAPMLALGYVQCLPGTPGFDELAKHLGIEDPEAAKDFMAHFPCLPYDQYKGVLIGPACSVDYEPDVLLVNCDNNFQLRALLWAIKYKTGTMLDVSLDPIDSCVYTLVKSMLTKEYTVAIPDPGEQERALSDRNEIILGVPIEKFEDLMEGVAFCHQRRIGYRDMQMQMQFDFERPSFYNKLFDMWGLGQGKVWDREEKR